MPKHNIDPKEFDKWAANKEVEYASVSVARKTQPTHKDRLRFWVALNGNYRVTLGTSTLYSGDSFNQAATVYNNAIGDRQEGQN